MSLLAGVLLYYAARGSAESDIWWHLCDARELLRNHSFSGVDTYSFTAAGAPWISFEWLAEVPYYLGFSSIGLRGILLVCFVVLLLIFIGVYYRCWRAGADCKDAAVATLVAICFGGVSIAPRTLLFGWLCMTGLLLVLDRFRRTGKGLLLLPPLFALWINLHGSWIFGVVVVALTIAGGLVEGQWGTVIATRWNAIQLRKLLLALAASIAAVFVNPFGYRLAFYPIDLILHQRGVIQFLDEWQPVDFSSWNGKLAMGLIFGILAAALFSKRLWRLDEAALTAFALWSALSHVRFLFFAGLVVVPILAPRLKLFAPYQREVDKPWLNGAIIAVAVGLMIFLFPSNASLQQKIDAEYPKAALQFMEQNNLQGHVFNQYKFGGYMQWFAPQIKTFIDGRADLFSHTGVINDFMKATALQDTFQIFDKYKIDYVLYEPRKPLSYMLEHSPGWRKIYSDNSTVLFARVPAAQ